MFGHKKTILVVDDDVNVLKSLEAILKEQGYRVETASDGVQALDKVQEHVPSLILMDIEMPHLKGDVAAMRLGRDDDLSKIPIILLTAYDSIQEEVLASHIGVVDYVTKPYDVENLLAKIKRHLEN